MREHLLIYAFFIIFTGAAVVATLALYARQAMLVAYIVLGALMGPGGFGLINDVALVEAIGHIGIVFLLFLLGLDLRPADLVHTIGRAAATTLLSSLVFGALGFAVGTLAGFSPQDSAVVGATLMFSSTILGLKLLPTTVLHHQHMGELMVGILLLQDLIAIAMLLMLQSYSQAMSTAEEVTRILVGIPVVGAVAYIFGRFVIVRLFQRFDTIREYIFLVTVGWCLGMAHLGAVFGFSHEIGAFVGGVTLATTPIAEYIAETLKPLRDFFLVMFFFAIGAAFRWEVFIEVWIWALVLAALALTCKPLVFRGLLRAAGERPGFAMEMGVRLGQTSEFSLLVAVMALQSGFIEERAAQLIQTATVIGLVLSSYWVVLRYPTPIAVSDRLRRD